MKENHVIFQDATIHYRIVGKGLPVVFVHGFAEDSTVWDNQTAFLQNDFKLIIPDLPGSGRSGLIDKEHIGLEDFAACIKQILTEENIEQVVMIGHSMGGYITLAFAEMFPGMLISFGLFHSSAYADDAEKIETRKKAISFIEKNSAFAFLQTSIPGLFYEQSNSALVNALIEKGRSFSAKALIQYYKAMIARPDRTMILENAHTPVLFVMGEHDKAVPFKHSLQQSHIPRQSYVHILRKSGHMGMLEEPAKANEIFTNFLLAQHSFIKPRQHF